MDSLATEIGKFAGTSVDMDLAPEEGCVEGVPGFADEGGVGKGYGDVFVGVQEVRHDVVDDVGVG